MNIKNLKCVSENKNIEEYLEFHNYVKANMEFPNWLGTFFKEEVI